MKDSELFKNLKFSQGQESEVGDSTRWLSRLETLLSRSKFERDAGFFKNQEIDLNLQAFLEDLNSQGDVDLEEQKLFFRLEAHLEFSTCTLFVYEKQKREDDVLDEGGTTVHATNEDGQRWVPLSTDSILQIRQASSTWTIEDHQWFKILAPYMITDSETNEVKIVLPAHLQKTILKGLSNSHRLFCDGVKTEDNKDEDKVWLHWEGKADFQLEVKKKDEEGDSAPSWLIWGKCIFESHRSDLWEISTLVMGGVFRDGPRLFEFSHDSAFFWAHELLMRGPFCLSYFSIGEFLFKSARSLGLEALNTSPHILCQLVPTEVTPLFYLKTQEGRKAQRGFDPFVRAQLWFRLKSYEYPCPLHVEQTVASEKCGKPPILRYQQEYSESEDFFRISLLTPLVSEEQQCLNQIQNHPSVTFELSQRSFKLEVKKTMDLIYQLLSQGWEVWAENLQIKIFNEMQVQVQTMQDWFEVGLQVGPEKKSLPIWQLILFLKKQSLFIKLGDGSVGILPEQWYLQLQRLWSLHFSDKEESKNDRLRFSFAYASALGDLENLSQDGATFSGDKFFHKMKSEFKNIQGLQPQTAPSSFCYTLRPYQELGLSWMSFLGSTSLGGCLADDMGLGKTVQLLAYLDQKRLEFFNRRIQEGNLSLRFRTLLVGPKSLLEPWVAEAKACAPLLKTAIILPSKRHQLKDLFASHDLLVVSYGFVRLYAEELLNAFHFDLVVLDEAQVIKNPFAQVSVGVKKLSGRQRLALTGTPIENHMGDLFSLFEFLNPGMIPADFLNLPSLDQESQSTSPVFNQILAGIRPLILRRTKSEIQHELPEKTEQRIVLPLSDLQGRLYQSLKLYYQDRLKKITQDDELFTDKAFFLEGLLRLRQVACHPVLLTKQKDFMKWLSGCEKNGDALLEGDFFSQNEVSNKISFLMEKLMHLASAQHKIVVFSQFTSFLRLLGQKLDGQELFYEYLDGQSQDRSGVIRRFQERGDRPILLAGIKTAGLGLNLTAADYCFIVDPWWNPAVEQQAMDRIYRLGQRKNVFIYKLVSENTVEEKMLELQQQKKKIADQLVTADQHFLKQLSFDDFQFLFQ